MTFNKNNAIQVIVDRLTKYAHFILVRTNFSLAKLTKLYIREIVKLHGVLVSIISNRDPRFTSRFWKSLWKALGTRLDLSTVHHPQTDGQYERTIQTLEDMLQCCILDLSGNQDDHLSLVEFTYNNSYQTSISMAPYKALYGRPCRTPLCWTGLEERVTMSPQIIVDTTKKIRAYEIGLRLYRAARRVMLT